MNNGIDIATLNAYIIIAEIAGNIIWNIYNAKRKEPLKLRYKLLMWCIIAFCIYLYDAIYSSVQIDTYYIIGLIIGSIGSGLMLGYCAELIVYIGGMFLNFLYKLIKDK